MIKWFREINDNDFNLVGGKGYNLGKMFNYGLNVPDGFIVTSLVYDDYVKSNKLQEKIDSIISSESSSLEKSREIKALLVEAFILSQKQALYCTEINDLVKIKKIVKRMYAENILSLIL